MKHLEEKSLPELREIATELGIDFASNIGKAKLIEKIIEDEALVEGKPTKVEGVPVKKKETASQIKKRMNILKRVRVSANDPQYKGRNGVALQIGNKTTVVGKLVPFDTPWHIQEPVYKALKRRKWRETKFVTDKTTGMKVPKVTMRPAFVIEDLDPLTEKELEKLAADQSARGSIPTEND